MTELFDESVFHDFSAFKNFNIIGVSNEADKFLLRNSRLKIVKPCNQNAQITLNPIQPCRGVNVYSMKFKTSTFTNLLTFKEIYVKKIDNVTPIEIKEYEPNKNYTINKKLTNLESAIMIKYYAFIAPIIISYELYTIIKSEFIDYREWFILDDIPIIQNINHELEFKSNLLNKPNLHFYETELLF